MEAELKEADRKLLQLVIERLSQVPAPQPPAEKHEEKKGHTLEEQITCPET
jgi:hypothetical protein